MHVLIHEVRVAVDFALGVGEGFAGVLPGPKELYLLVHHHVDHPKVAIDTIADIVPTLLGECLVTRYEPVRFSVVRE